MTEKPTPDAVLAGSSIALPVPGGTIRMTYGGGLTVEPATAPSVEQIARVIYLHTMWQDHRHGECVAPECRWTSQLTGTDLRDANNAHVAEEIRALWSPAPGDADEVHSLAWWRQQCSEQEALRIEATERAEKAEALAAHKQTVIDEDRADTKRNRELWAEAAYANGEEITLLRAVVEAAEGRIDALLKVDAAVADLREAKAGVEAAEEAIEVATDLDLEAAKVLNAAKAKYAMQASTDPWAERDAEVPQ